MNEKEKLREIGIVGIGLMGASIVTALLISGNRVVAVAPMPADLDKGPDKIRQYLAMAYQNNLTELSPEENLARLTITEDYARLRNCQLVMECVVENIEVKKQIFAQVEQHISPDAILTTNTSAIPNTVLKDFVQHPRRFMGMHWAEPAFTTKFLEIVCNPETELELAEKLYAMTADWGKEPILVRKDIRGFITNRLMYAMYREAFNLVENGYATIEDVDRACRNDGGHWMTFCGLFRYMDITGLQAYYAVMKDLFPTLSNQTEVPQLIENIAQQGGNGITNGKGFYDYTPAEAAEWEKAYEEFAFDISRLSAKYPIDLIEKRLKSQTH